MEDRRIRWWPLYGIGALLVAMLVWVWTNDEFVRQIRLMGTAAAIVLSLLLTGLWVLLASRLPWRSRLMVVGCSALVLFSLTRLVRVESWTGDVVPVFDWSWSQPEQAAEPAAPAPEPIAPSAVASTDWQGRFDYPQFLGPDRNATVRGLRLARDWQSTPPREIWRRPVGESYAAFAIVGERAVTQEQRGEMEAVVAYDVRSGEELWAHEEPASLETVFGNGPRSTPTIVDGRVYTLGGLGRLQALDLATGTPYWSIDVLADNGAELPEWGVASSPLVSDGRVIVNPGGPEGRSLVAYDAVSGERVWAAGTDLASYASPMIATLAGVEQVVSFNRGSVTGHDPATGTILWDHPWPPEQANVMQPVPLPGDRLLLSAGYGMGAQMLQLGLDAAGGWSVEMLWESPRLKAKFTNVVYVDGHVYGLDDGVMICLDPETGERCWKRGRYGHGQVLLVEDLLLVVGEEGELLLLDPDPEQLVELARIDVLEGPVWNNPALTGRYLLLRNQTEAVCYELPSVPS